MNGMTKADADRLEAKALGPGPLRPRDAATLILLDRSGWRGARADGQASHAACLHARKIRFSRRPHRSGRQPRRGRLRSAPERRTETHRGSRADQPRPRPRHCAVGHPRDLRGGRPADRRARFFRRGQRPVAGFRRTRRASGAARIAHDRARHHAARAGAPLRHAVSRRLAKRCRGGVARGRSDAGAGGTRLAAPQEAQPRWTSPISRDPYSASWNGGLRKTRTWRPARRRRSTA